MSMYKSNQCDEAIILVYSVFFYLVRGLLRRYGCFSVLFITFSPVPESLSSSVVEYSVGRGDRFGGGTALGFVLRLGYGGISGLRLCLVPPQKKANFQGNL